MKRSRPAIPPSVIRKLREISEQITDAFWNDLHSEYAHLAEWTLQYFQTEFDVARTPHQLQPKTHTMLLNLEVLCSLISQRSSPASHRLEALRHGVADSGLKISDQTVLMEYSPTVRLTFSAAVMLERPVIITPFITAPWDEDFYFNLGRLGAYLVKKRKPPKRIREQFNDAIRNNIRQQAPATRKRSSDPKLKQLFDRMNENLFGNKLPEVTVRWGRFNKRKLGHWDAFRNEIVINPLLNKPEVPPYVLHFILFHEMLHIALPPYRQNGRLLRHHKEFKAAEKQFPYYFQSKTWIEEEWPKHYRRYRK